MPRMRIRDAGGVLRSINRIRMRDAGGTLRLIQRIRMRDAGGTLRTVFQYFTATAIPTNVTGSYNGSSPAAQNIATGATIASLAGGTAPYTYSWAQVGTTPYTWTISNAASATTYFTGLAIPLGVDSTAFFECTVTDINGIVVKTQVVQAYIANNSTA